MARKPRILYPGALYHVYNRGNDRHPIFRDDDDRMKYLWYLAKYAQEMSVVLIAYCLLTNHFHFFLRTLLANLPKFMHRLNLGYVKWYNKKRSRTGHLYTSRYQASLVQEGSYALELSRYIHLNPVKANLVAQPEEWPWSSYPHFIGLKQNRMLDTEIILDQFGSSMRAQQEAYRAFTLEGLHEGTAWDEPPVKDGLFLGDDSFIKEICEKYHPTELGPAACLTKAIPGLSMHNILHSVLQRSGLSFMTLKESKRRANTYWRNMFIFLSRTLTEVPVRELADLLSLSQAEISRLIYRFESRLEGDAESSERVKSIVSSVLQSGPSAEM